MQAFLNTHPLSPAADGSFLGDTFLQRLCDSCAGDDPPCGVYNYSKFVWSKYETNNAAQVDKRKRKATTALNNPAKIAKKYSKYETTQALLTIQKISRGFLVRKTPHEWEAGDVFVTRGGLVSQDGYRCTNAAATFSKTAESDTSALASGTMGEPLTAEKVLSLRAHLSKTHRVEMFDMTTPDGTPAVVLIVRKLFDTKCFAEIITTKPEFVDKLRRAYGKVGRKNARWNTNVGPSPVRGDIGNDDPRLRFSTQVPYAEFPHMAAARDFLAGVGRATGIDLEDLKAEINFYFNQPGQTASQRRDANGYIGFHGDAERNGVIGSNLSDGMTRDIVWREYYRNSPTGRQWRATLFPGDCYIMCSKACGMDWKRSGIYTHRHAAGSAPGVDWMIAQVDKRIRKRKAAAALKKPAKIARH